MAGHEEQLGQGGAFQDIESQVPPEAFEAVPANPISEIAEVGQSLFTQGEVFLASLFRTWNLYQVGIAVGLLLLSVVLRRLFAPRLHEWMRTREGWPKWRLRWLLVIHKRLGGIIFVAMIWAVVFAMREITWPSRSYLLGIIATLATAWLVVTFATRLIANPLLRKERKS